MSVNDPITVKWDDKRQRYYLLQGRETFYSENREWIQFDTREQAENYRSLIMDKHTALPWKVVSGMIVRASDDAPIAHMERSEAASKAGIYPVERDDNAKFIVRVCNHYADMIEALERVESELIDVDMEVPQYVTDAIRRAKGE